MDGAMLSTTISTSNGGYGRAISAPGSSLGDERQFSQLEMQMAGLNTSAAPATAAEVSSKIEVTAFLAAALPLLCQIDSFKAQVMRITPSSDHFVVGMQSVISALGESRAALVSSNTARSALPVLFGEGSRSNKLTCATDTAQAFQALVSTFTESSDQ